VAQTIGSFNDHTVDILYARKLVEGYLIAADRPGSGGWLFRFKGIPRQYFVIVDATSGRHVHHLARLVACVPFAFTNWLKETMIRERTARLQMFCFESPRPRVSLGHQKAVGDGV
jgi:hypothetical protein